MAEFGNNETGTLGNGTNDDMNVVTQVKIDENTNLENIIKIAVRNRTCTSTYKKWRSFRMGTKFKWRTRTRK